MKTKIRKEVLWAISVYVFLLLLFGGWFLYEACRPLNVEDYQITALRLDKSEPTYYVVLNGGRSDVSAVSPNQEQKHKVLMYEGLEVTCLRFAEEKYVYVISGALSVDEVLSYVRGNLKAIPAGLLSVTLVFGSWFLWKFCKSEK